MKTVKVITNTIYQTTSSTSKETARTLLQRAKEDPQIFNQQDYREAVVFILDAGEVKLAVELSLHKNFRKMAIRFLPKLYNRNRTGRPLCGVYCREIDIAFNERMLKDFFNRFCEKLTPAEKDIVKIWLEREQCSQKKWPEALQSKDK